MDVVYILVFLAILLDEGTSASSSQDRVKSVGNGPRPSKFQSESMSWSNFVFIDSTPLSASGTLFGMSLYLLTAAPMRLQVWRRANVSNPQQLALFYDYPYAYTGALPASQDIVLTACTPVQAGDLLGLFFDGPNGSVAYVYSQNSANTMQTKFDSIPVINSTHIIDILHFPYLFSVASWILYDSVNGTSEWNGACPRGIVIPEYASKGTPSTTTRPPPTGAMGGTGATGDTGPKGPPGAYGVIGPIGQMGFTGSIGNTGPLGTIGSGGATGEKGVNGSVGPLGPMGTMGKSGPTGDTGPPGPKGQKGLDATWQPPVPPSSEALSMKKWWRSESLITGVYIWLAILSFILLLSLVWSAVLCHKFNKLTRRRMASSKDNLITD